MKNTLWKTLSVALAASGIAALPAHADSNGLTNRFRLSQRTEANGFLLRHSNTGPIQDPDINSRGDRMGHLLSVALSPAAIAGGAFLLADNRHRESETRNDFEGMALTGAATLILKKAFNERRPNGGGGSFPSGHASLAFSLATSLTENHPKYKLLAYGAATAVAWARVEVDAHYWHDVTAGAALGYLMTKRCMRHHLIVSPGGFGLQQEF